MARYMKFIRMIALYANIVFIDILTNTDEFSLEFSNGKNKANCKKIYRRQGSTKTVGN